MKRLGLGTVLLVIAASLVFLARGGGRKPSARPPPEGAPAEVREVGPTLPRVEDGNGVPETQGAREAAERTSSSPPASELAPAPAVVELTVRARLVDERGAPLAEGWLTLPTAGGELSAKSTPDGEVALALELRDLDRPGASFEVGAPDRIRRSIQVARALVEGSSSYFLGEFVLLPAGTLVGRVVDELGAPVPYTRVIARPPATNANPAERVFLPWSWFGDGIRISGNGAADGTYRLAGVPRGTVEVLASDGKRLVARSGALEVRAAEETRVPDLVLGTPQASDRIGGRVTHADGRPFPDLDIGLSTNDDGRSWPGARSDADGRFTLLAVQGVVYTLLARVPDSSREAKRSGVRAGDQDVELVFGEERDIELTVSDVRGPVASFRVIVENAQRRGVSAQSCTEGHARVALPSATFYLSVVNWLHRPQRLGPFEPEKAPERLEVVLELVGGVAGIVLAGGAPVPQAVVHAHTRVDGASFGLTPADFVTFVEPSESTESRTDENGRFFLPLHRSNRYRLHASAPEHARGASDWVAFTDGASVDGFDIHLPAGGAIEGRLLVASGVDARGVWIGASDGEGHVELAQTGEGGSFRFERLAPGPWQVHRVGPGEEEYLSRNQTYWPVDDETGPPVWDVTVPEGKTVAFDIDARDEVPCSLEGRFAFEGAGAQGYSAFLDVAAKGTLLDPDGRFTLRAPKAGRYPLYLWRGDAQLQVWLELAAGPNAWELDLPAGTVQLDNLPPVPLDPRMGRQDWPEYALLWTRGELRWTARLQEGPTASARLEHVPAGALVLRWRSDGADPSDEQNWPVLAEIELAAGELVTLRLP